VDAHLIDSEVFGHLWSTDWSRALFAERSRLARWLHVIAALGRAQARLGIIPGDAAEAIDQLTIADLDIGRIATGTRATAHSTLGLIQEMQRHLPESAREHVYLGATVQDVTDTALALEMRVAGAAMWVDLGLIEDGLLALAERHASTPMTGRTHGQPGAPITFGLKVASWMDELQRHLDRFEQGSERWLVAQLGGAVGTLAFFGDLGVPLRREFAAELGLRDPTVPWLSARDRVAEFGSVVSMTATSLARLANEVYSLQRAEIGEVGEATTATVVGSITMPHKRNPESSEQVVTLARLARAQASVLVDSMVHEHERDARGWKAEWIAVPEICHYAGAALALTRQLVAGLEVHTEVMASNLDAVGATASEQALRELAPEHGKHRAQAMLHEAYRSAGATGRPLGDFLPEGVTIGARDHHDVGAAAAMTMAVVASTRARRLLRSDPWLGVDRR
jgi:adenylosuccinate lyase